MGELMTTDTQALQALTVLIQQTMSPVLAQMAELLKNNTEAIQSLAAQEKIQTDRLNALEKEIRLLQPVTRTQVRYINDAMKARARDILSKKDLQDDKTAVKETVKAIKKSVLSRYGIAAVGDIPKHEYTVAMNQIGSWSDMLVLRDVAAKARKRSVKCEPAARCSAQNDEKDYSGLVEE